MLSPPGTRCVPRRRAGGQRGAWYARRGRALSGAEVEGIAGSHTARWRYHLRVMPYWDRYWFIGLVPLGLFPGAFDRRAAGVLVSPELPVGLLPGGQITRN